MKDIQIEIAYRNTESGENGEWTTIVLNGDNYKYGGNYLLQVPTEGTYEVAITLIGANELRSESKSQLAEHIRVCKDKYVRLRPLYDDMCHKILLS